MEVRAFARRFAATISGGMSQEVTNSSTEGEDGERFLSNADLGRRYNKSRMTIYRWQQAGYLPAPRLAGGKLPMTNLAAGRGQHSEIGLGRLVVLRGQVKK